MIVVHSKGFKVFKGQSFPRTLLNICNKFKQYKYMIFKNEYNFQYVMVYKDNYYMNEFIHNMKIIKKDLTNVELFVVEKKILKNSYLASIA